MSLTNPPSASRDTRSICAVLASALERALALPVEIWFWDDSWQVGAQSESVEEADSGLRQNVALVLETLKEPLRAPRIIDTSRGALLVLPLDVEQGNPRVATAEVGSASCEHLLRLAQNIYEDYRRRQSVLHLRHELDACSFQMTQNLEEMTFLRNLAECLELSELPRDRWQTAKAVLPVLKQLVHARSLVLLSTCEGSRPHSAGSAFARPVAGTGEWETHRTSLEQVLAAFGAEAEVAPLVRNRLHQVSTDLCLPDVHELMLVPIRRQGTLFGWLLAINRLPAECEKTGSNISAPRAIPAWGLSDLEFGTGEVSLMETAAAVIAASSHALEMLQQKEDLLVGTVRVLVAVIEARDPYTFGHSERVALIARRLGEELGLSRQQCHRLYLTGLVHDLGKVGVRDEILQKPGRLTPEEFEEVKRHPDIGHAILQQLDCFDFALTGIRHHHERYDGGGYPEGWAGDQIPLEARILAVADAFDAMTSNRPYRPGLPVSRVARILLEGSGKQWDPQVVRAMAKAARDVLTISSTYQPPIQQRQDGTLGPISPIAACVNHVDVSGAIDLAHSS